MEWIQEVEEVDLDLEEEVVEADEEDSGEDVVVLEEDLEVEEILVEGEVIRIRGGFMIDLEDSNRCLEDQTQLEISIND